MVLPPLTTAPQNPEESPSSGSWDGTNAGTAVPKAHRRGCKFHCSTNVGTTVPKPCTCQASNPTAKAVDGTENIRWRLSGSSSLIKLLRRDNLSKIPHWRCYRNLTHLTQVYANNKSGCYVMSQKIHRICCTFITATSHQYLCQTLPDHSFSKTITWPPKRKQIGKKFENNLLVGHRGCGAPLLV